MFWSIETLLGTRKEFAEKKGAPVPANQISSLIDVHKYSRTIVLGSAPSLSAVGDHPADVGIFVGDSMLRTTLRPKTRFYVRANSEYPNLHRRFHLKDLEELGARMVFAQSVLESPTPVFDLIQKLEVPAFRDSFLFDQRHFFGKPCTPPRPCCSALETKDFPYATIQELLSNYCGEDRLYSSGSTVSLHAAALAVLIGSSEVHIAGVEVPLLAKDYVYSKRQVPIIYSFIRTIDEIFFQIRRLLSQYPLTHIPGVVMKWFSQLIVRRLKNGTPSFFAPDYDEIIADFQLIFRSAEKVGVKVYVCSSTSKLNSLSGVTQCPLIASS